MPGGRPTGLILIVIMQLILAIVSLVLGVLFLILPYGIEYVLGGSLEILAGMLFLFAVFGSWGLKSWAWMLTIITCIVTIAGNLFFMIVASMPIIYGIAQVIVSAIILIYYILPATRIQFDI